MKKYISFIFLFVLSFPVFAESISYSDAYNKALEFLGKDIAVCNNVRSRSHVSSEGSSYYIFNASDGHGFVIIGGTKSSPKILGYSRNNPFVYDDDNAGVKSLLNNISSFSTESNAISELTSSTDVYPIVEPLLKTQWGQSAPYNLLCPTNNGKRCYVGCVATALSQVMYYWKWPNQGIGNLSYVCTLNDVGKISVNFSESVYEWDYMKLNTADNNSSEESKRAISRLCFDCGVATRMEYGTDGSGAWPQYIAEGIYKYFGYKASTLRILYRSCFATQEEWNDIVKKELDAGRPIIYSGYSETGGHCFVFDGYDSNDFVHVNWGWQGQCDGYFAIDVLNAQYNDVYKDGHDMIVGLEPDYLGSDTKPQPWYPYVMGGINCNGTSKGYKLGSQIFCDVPKIYNKAPFVMTWTVGIGLFDNVGNLVCNVKKQNFNEESDELVFGGFYGKNSFTTVVSIPSTCPDGEYTLKLMFKQDGYDEWFMPDVEGGSLLNCVSVSVSDGRAYINKIPVSITTNEVEDCQVVDYYSFDGLKQKDVTAHGLHIEKVKNIDGSITYRKVFTK